MDPCTATSRLQGGGRRDESQPNGYTAQSGGLSLDEQWEKAKYAQRHLCFTILASLSLSLPPCRGVRLVGSGLGMAANQDTPEISRLRLCSWPCCDDPKR
jgi:hypothetical protein